MSKEDVLTLVELVKELILAAKKSPLGLPLGPLYARVMDKLSLEQFNTLVHIACDTGLVKVEHHCLTYIGPEILPERGDVSNN